MVWQVWAASVVCVVGAIVGLVFIVRTFHPRFRVFEHVDQHADGHDERGEHENGVGGFRDATVGRDPHDPQAEHGGDENSGEDQGSLDRDATSSGTVFGVAVDPHSAGDFGGVDNAANTGHDEVEDQNHDDDLQHQSGAGECGVTVHGGAPARGGFVPTLLTRLSGRESLELQVARAEARAIESERDRLLDANRVLEGEVQMLRRMLDLAQDVNEARDRELTELMQSVTGMAGELRAVESKWREAESAIDLALQGCIDREAVTAPVQVAGSLYDEAVES